MSTPRETFQSLLREMFQIEAAAELDFGIYRILGQKRGVVEKFINEQLIDAISAELNSGALRQEAGIAAQIADLAAQIRENIADDAIDAAGNLAASHHGTKLGRQYLALQQQAKGARPANDREASIYNHLVQFFSRYYDNGDFLSLRRYSKREKYAIPYNGEEVHLHWANADQYYIKTGEQFTEYRWRDPAGGVRVRFTVTQADVPKDNIKSPDTRYFLPQTDALTLEQAGAPKDKHILVTLPFHYRGLTAAEADRFEQEAKDRSITSNGKIQSAILAVAAESLAKSKTLKENPEPLNALLAEHHKDADGNPVSRLAHHLRRFSRKNSSDYFIHKDLEGFLSRELDFYLKNEVLQLDSLDAGGEERAEGWFQMMRLIRRIGQVIIRFLAQIENFQKRIFEKKKFVTASHFCLTLDRIPESLYPEIAKNTAQIAEWKHLFSIHEAKGWTETPSVAFLKKNWNLVVDTKFFDEAFLDEALASSVSCDGLLLCTENYQGLAFLQEMFGGCVDVAYIDPPYNTDASPILYKNGYKSSTWCSFIKDRLTASRPLLTRNGVLIAAIDDEQERELDYILSSVFENNILGTICVRSNPSGRPKQTGYSVSHEYMIYAGNSEHASISRMPPTEEQLARFNQTDEEGAFEWRNLRREGSNSDRDARRELFYPIFIKGDKIRVPKLAWDEKTESWSLEEKPKSGESIVWPINDEGDEKTWRWEHATVSSSLERLAVRKDRSGKDYVYYKRRPHEAGVVAVSSWFDAKYSSVEHGTGVLKALFGKSPFSYPKSKYAVEDAIYIGGASKKDAIVLDYFGGSGTTAHGVIDLNRKSPGSRSYVLIEQEEYFDSILKSRVIKVIYSSDWKAGKPQTRDAGISHCFQYLKLESYEDALGNIAFNENEAAQRQLRFDEYVIHYMLAFETGQSETLLDCEKLATPFDYKLEIRDNGDTAVNAVDLPATFNFLIGLRVRTRKVYWRTLGKQKLRYLVYRGRTNPHATGGEREVVVVWRTTKEWVLKDFQADREFIQKEKILEGSDEAFANTDCLMEGIKSLDPVFKRRMFNQGD